MSDGLGVLFPKGWVLPDPKYLCPGPIRKSFVPWEGGWLVIISHALQGVGEFRLSQVWEGALLPPGEHGQGGSPHQCNTSFPVGSGSVRGSAHLWEVWKWSHWGAQQVSGSESLQ